MQYALVDSSGTVINVVEIDAGSACVDAACKGPRPDHLAWHPPAGLTVVTTGKVGPGDVVTTADIAVAKIAQLKAKTL